MFPTDKEIIEVLRERMGTDPCGKKRILEKMEGVEAWEAHYLKTPDWSRVRNVLRGLVHDGQMEVFEVEMGDGWKSPRWRWL